MFRAHFLPNMYCGFLPGEIDDKLAPYMQPLFDNLGVIRHQFAKSDSRHRNILQLLESEKLVIAPLSYIRGRSLVDAYFIVDEGQNLTPHEIKTIINTKMFLITCALICTGIVEIN